MKIKEDIEKIISGIFSKDLLNILKKYNAFVVGGFLRDVILGNENIVDIDVIIDEKNRIEFLNEFSKFFKVIVETGKAKSKLNYRFIKEKFWIDVTFEEIDVLEKWANLRDFTINSLYYDLANSKLIDFFGGVDDLKERILVPVNKEILLEDPVRIFRVARFFLDGFKVDNSIFDLIWDYRFLYKVSNERIYQEIYKVFSKKVEEGKIFEVLNIFERFNIFKYFLVAFEDLRGLEQNEYHKFDVWTHTKYCVDLISRYAKDFDIEGDRELFLLRMAALFHDVGKAFALNKRGNFYEHEKISFELFENIVSKKIALSNKERKAISMLIKEHMFAFYNYLDFDDERKKRSFVRRYWLKRDKIGKLLLVLHIADYHATFTRTKEKLDRRLSLLKEFLRLKEELFKEKPKPILTGKEIMKILNLAPGKLIGKIKEEIFNLQLQELIKSKEEAIDYLLSKKWSLE